MNMALLKGVFTRFFKEAFEEAFGETFEELPSG